MLSGFCPSCNRTLYVDESATPFCPVCSSPVLASVHSERDVEGPSDPGADGDASTDGVA